MKFSCPIKPQNNVIFYSRFSTTGNTNFSFRSYFQRIASTKELGIFPSNPHCLSRKLFSAVTTCRILDHPHLWLNEREINLLRVKCGNKHNVAKKHGSCPPGTHILIFWLLHLLISQQLSSISCFHFYFYPHFKNNQE